jgi:hypothetical protein
MVFLCPQPSLALSPWFPARSPPLCFSREPLVTRSVITMLGSVSVSHAVSEGDEKSTGFSGRPTVLRVPFTTGYPAALAGAASWRAVLDALCAEQARRIALLTGTAWPTTNGGPNGLPSPWACASTRNFKSCLTISLRRSRLSYELMIDRARSLRSWNVPVPPHCEG